MGLCARRPLIKVVLITATTATSPMGINSAADPEMSLAFWTEMAVVFVLAVLTLSV